MEELDYWRLCEELNIVQAALLVVGEAPIYAGDMEEWEIGNRPKGYDAAKTAISGALRNYENYQKELADLERQTRDLEEDYGNPPNLVYENQDYLEDLARRSIVGVLVAEQETDINGNELGELKGTVDVYRSIIQVDSLRRWLAVKGFKSGFFFPEPIETMDFLDPFNHRYAPKLVAAYRAWESVIDSGKKSPKQALDKWLREHAADFGLTNDEGKPIEQAIEECSKVANWNTKGGATKTPG